MNAAIGSDDRVDYARPVWGFTAAATDKGRLGVRLIDTPTSVSLCAGDTPTTLTAAREIIEHGGATAAVCCMLRRRSNRHWVNSSRSAADIADRLATASPAPMHNEMLCGRNYYDCGRQASRPTCEAVGERQVRALAQVNHQLADQVLDYLVREREIHGVAAVARQVVRYQAWTPCQMAIEVCHDNADRILLRHHMSHRPDGSHPVADDSPQEWKRSGQLRRSRASSQHDNAGGSSNSGPVGDHRGPSHIGNFVVRQDVPCRAIGADAQADSELGSWKCIVGKAWGGE